jgi:hypothetical protein
LSPLSSCSGATSPTWPRSASTAGPLPGDLR